MPIQRPDGGRHATPAAGVPTLARLQIEFIADSINEFTVGTMAEGHAYNDDHLRVVDFIRHIETRVSAASSGS
ncbi:hypothetical protein E4K10_30460 [Streptomyces sp. T1317-0309]|nr:hypothetical protein E4K10_30460 [Streptomyces sp. T1317-0309]